MNLAQSAIRANPVVGCKRRPSTDESLNELMDRMPPGDQTLWKSIPQGAATQCYVACHPAVAAVSGAYFSNCNVARPTAPGRDAALATRLWAESERIVARLG